MPLSKRTVERIIGRLSREIAEIDQHFYGGFEEKDRNLLAGMLDNGINMIARTTLGSSGASITTSMLRSRLQ